MPLTPNCLTKWGNVVKAETFGHLFLYYDELFGALQVAQKWPKKCKFFLGGFFWQKSDWAHRGQGGEGMFGKIP